MSPRKRPGNAPLPLTSRFVCVICGILTVTKIVYLNVGIFENMTRMNSLQITKDDSRGSMSIVCRSFDENGEAIADEFSFSADETKEIEAEAESFTQTFLTETKLL